MTSAPAPEASEASATTAPAASSAATPATTPATTPRRHRDAVRCALLAVGWQVALTLFGALVERPLRGLVTGAQGPTPPAYTVLSHTYRFDATWISPILEGSYTWRPQSAAFYPLFPLLVRAVQLVSFDTLGILVAGLLVNTLALWAALYALLVVARHFTAEPGRAWFAVLALLGAPTAYYLHVFYSEGVFIALGFTAYRFALERRWTPMGLCLLPLTASRVTAILVLGLCFLEFWRARGWGWRALHPAVLWFPGALLGFAAYAAYLWTRTGDAWGMFTAYAIEPSWSYTDFEPNVLLTLGRAAAISGRALVGAAPFTNFVLVDQVLPLLALAVLLVASTYLLVTLRGAGVPLALYGYATALMITLNGNLVAVHRYVLPALGIYVALAVLAGHGGVRRAVGLGHLYLGVLVQSLLFAMFTANLWAG